MATYYVYCENHGVIGTTYNSKSEALAKRSEHIMEGDGHGKVHVIEVYEVLSYGKMLEKRRKFK